MSECGMALSNPYRPLEGRTVGHVGLPLPGVSARLATPTDKGLEPLVTVESPDPDTQVFSYLKNEPNNRSETNFN